MGKTLKYDLGLFPTVFRLFFLGAKAPLGIARVKKKRHEKVSELNDFIIFVK